MHAYSPPLTAMSYYEVTERGTLRRERTELTDQPEGDAVSRIDAVLDAARARLHRLVAPPRCPTRCDAVRCWSTSGRPPSVPPRVRCRAALVIERNVLEWRCDPTSDARLPQAVGDDVEWVILCSEGYTSSLAAAALQDLGLHRATDVVGGYHALVAEGVLV